MKKTFKVIGRIFLVFVLIVALLCALGGIYYSVSRSCDLTIRINESDEKQTLYGWGSSACWWSDDITDAETRSEIAKLLYSEEGLGMNIYRYNVAGGYDPENNRVDNAWRLNESFYYLNEETGEYEFDFSRDAAAQAMLDECLSYGCIDTVILFANSPHYSMCKNGQSSGSEDGMCNLKEDSYQDYVDYFLTITEYFIDKGVPVKYISPINEPQWNWGGDSPAQEGCHYEQDEIVALFELFAQGIRSRGLDVSLYGPESANIGDTTKRFYTALTENETIGDTLSAFSYHSYYSDSDLLKKIKFGSWAKETVTLDRFDMSEWCELPTEYATTDVKSACRMARVISQDIGATGVNSWSAWVAMNQDGISESDSFNYSDGLLVADPENTADFEIAYRYYAMKHYSAFVPSGSVVLDCDESVFTVTAENTDDGIVISKLVNATAYKTPEGNIVVVVVNEGNDRSLKLKVDSGQVDVYTTNAELKCEETYSGAVQDSYTIDADSINTFVFYQ